MSEQILTEQEIQDYRENSQKNVVMVVYLPNPFNINDREIKYVPFNGQKLSDIAVSYMIPKEKFNFSINGELVPDEMVDNCYLNAGDCVALAAKVEGGDDGPVKAVLYAVALVILYVYAPSAAGWLSKTIGGTATFWEAAVMVVGGLLVTNLIYGNQKNDDQNDDSPNYSWGKLSAITTPGYPVPMTFGTVRTAGMILSQHVVSSGEKQYLRLLLCGGEGPCDYTGNGENDNCTGISNIQINGNKAEYYPEVQINRRAGLNDQSIMQNFNDVYEDEFPDLKLINDNILPDSEWRTWTTNGNLGQSLEVTIGFPMGLCYTEDDGDQVGTWVRFEVQYSVAGQNNWKYIQQPHHFSSARRISANTIKIPNGDYRGYFTPGRSVEVYWDYQWHWMTVSYSSYTDYEYDDSIVWANYTTVVLTADVPTNTSSIRSWTNDVTISRNTNKSFHYTIRQDTGVSAQYDVRVRCTGKGTSGAENRYARMCVFEQLSHIAPYDFIYPNKILLGVTALATDQFSSFPTITWEQTRTYGWVYHPVNGYVQKRMDNPAWAAYDVIHRCQRLKNINTGEWEYLVRGVPAARIDYYSFEKWAEYCDYVVPETGQKRCIFNFILDTKGNIWDALKYMEQVGRGKVILKGTRFAAICDRPLDPGEPYKAMFNVSNITNSSFKRAWMSAEDRCNAIEVTFFNREKNYEKDVFTVYAEGYDALSAPNPRAIQLLGITDFDHAYREAWYQLRMNKYLVETCSFSADIDAIGCEVGDVILVQHNRPGWGTGGRLIAATTSEITLDKAVTLKANTPYSIRIRYADDTLVLKDIVQVTEDTTTNIVTLTTPLTTAPAADDLYVLSEVGVTGKPFRVIQMQRDGELRMKLVCLEYKDEVYAELETIPERDYSVDIPESMPQVTLTQFVKPDHTVWITATWPQFRINVKEYRIEVDGEVIGYALPHERSFSFQIFSMKEYVVRVIAINDQGVEIQSEEAAIAISGSSFVPATTVANLRVSLAGSGIPKLMWDELFGTYRYAVYRVDGNHPVADETIKLNATRLTYAAGTEYSDTTIDYGSQYTYYVVPTNSRFYEGTWSGGLVVNVPTFETVDTPPASLADIGVGFDPDVVRNNKAMKSAVSVYMNLTAIPDDDIRAYIRVQYRKTGANEDWSYATNIYPTGSTARCIINMLEPDEDYTIWLVPISKWGKEGTAYQTTHHTDHDTVAPKAPANIQYVWNGYNSYWYWNRVTKDENEADCYDVEGYEVRTDLNFGQNDAGLVYKGPATSCIADAPTERLTNYYFKTYDFWGNYSTNAATVQLHVQLPDTPSPPKITEFFSNIWVEIVPVTSVGVRGYKVYYQFCEADGTPIGEEWNGIDIGWQGRVSLPMPAGSHVLLKVTAYDCIGESLESSVIQANAKVLDDITAFADDMMPVQIVTTLPELPNAAFPPGCVIFLQSNGKLYSNQNNQWGPPAYIGEGTITGTQIADGAISTEKIEANAVTADQLAANSVVSGKIAAGAVSAQEIAAGAITAEKVGANEIIANTANIKDGVITNAKIESLDASKITLGNDKSGIPFVINSDTDQLWHFDNNNLKSTQELEPEAGYSTTQVIGGKFSGAMKVNTTLQYHVSTVTNDYSIGFYSIAPPYTISKTRNFVMRRIF
jgi:predicted phage tail protein